MFFDIFSAAVGLDYRILTGSMTYTSDWFLTQSVRIYRGEE